MSAEATTIPAVRCLTVATCVSYTRDFKLPSRRHPKDGGLENVETQQQAQHVQSTTRDSRMKAVIHCNRKMSWCTIIHKPQFLVRSGRYSL
ncbi:hypothetical protein TNCV_1491101 [Trichonephila clavipes]|nr:hypothetical protein TNCV_1491101 [Trichonephila clavipes]